MKKIVAIMVMLLMVLALSTTGVLAAKSENGRDKSAKDKPQIQVEEQEVDLEVEAEEDEELKEDIEAEEELEAELEAELEEEESIIEEVYEEDDGEGNGWAKGLWKQNEGLQSKLEEKQEKIVEKMEWFEETGKGDLEAKKAEFEQRLQQLEVDYQEKVELLAGKLAARGNVIEFSDAFPVIKQGRTLIPVRAVIETVGAAVYWDGENNQVTIQRDDITLVLQPGEASYTVNGETKTFDVPAETINNRTFVPLRYIAEELGEVVEYDEETGNINLEEPEEETGDQVLDN
ncbi:copper amine oxidase N-terminal domain-containing protein [Metallumcola ferriviriculae]|uniref:Copper amine oxidase N-terminal domain-containing protein n=1 Tax=Metallumcola ferriviriculae TaxID=3039180 RepID=A0AAU0UIX6_9FIRM|nr:copper amine oxidase N-terminal domain-containing protein [Desulfitibacteraceae bacterium MK1]